MAKKRYHIVFKRVQELLSNHSSTINHLNHNPKEQEYKKRFSKAHYLVEIEDFLKAFHILQNESYTLQLLNYFESLKFYKILHELMGYKKTEDKRVSSEVLIGLGVLYERDEELYRLFLRQTFVHYSTTQTAKN